MTSQRDAELEWDVIAVGVIAVVVIVVDGGFAGVTAARELR